MYTNGRGVTRNYQEARRLYALALAQGHDYVTKELTELEARILAECPLLGNRVVVTRTSRRYLNGKTGMAASFDNARGRYVVALGKPAT